MVSSSFIYKIDDKNLLYDIQTIYEYDIPLFEWWVDYETKFIEHIDKYIFNNLALKKLDLTGNLIGKVKLLWKEFKLLNFKI